MSFKTGFILDIILVIITIVSSFTTVLWQDTQEEVDMLLEKADYYIVFADEEVEWLLDNQLDNGALPLYSGKTGYVSVVPYFSCHAAIALVEYGSEQSLQSAKAYMQWHFSHLNQDAPDIYGLKYTIYDYNIKIKDSKVISEKSRRSYDSSDSYAALMLTLLNRYTQKTDDIDYASEHYAQFEGIVGVIDNLMYKGLAYTSPVYPVSFLMDNCEVYEGMNDAAILMETVYLPEAESSEKEYEKRLGLYNKIVFLRDEVLQNIEKLLWNEENGYYEYGIQESKHYFGFDWDSLYPDAIAQLTPITSGVINYDSDRAKTLYNSFNERYKWENMKTFLKDEKSYFYWSSLVYSAAVMKDYDKVAVYLEEVRLHILPERSYPYNNHEASSIIRAAIVYANSYLNEADRIDPLYLYHERR